MRKRILKLIGNNWIAELNSILKTDFTKKDCKDIFSKNNIIQKACDDEFKRLPNVFYTNSKNYVFLNCAKNLTGMGYFYLPLVYVYGRNKKFLDYGAGAGNSIIIANGGTYVDVKGIASQTAIARFKSRNIKAKIIYAKNNKFAEIKGNYDCVCCCEVLEHVNNAELLLKFLCDKVKIKGYLILSYSFSAHEDITHLTKYGEATKLKVKEILHQKGFVLHDKDIFKGHFKVYKKVK
jgi:2-polyprenyl-3-methyl-5-hydroxy-6-metoxy-1,4-benzoquinol methylase